MQMKIGLNVGTFARLPCANQYFAISTKADLIESVWNTCKATFFFYSPCIARCTPFCINCTWRIWWLTWMQLFAIQTRLFSLLSSKRLFHWKCTNFGTKKIGKRGRWWKMTWSHTHTRHDTIQHVWTTVPLDFMLLVLIRHFYSVELKWMNWNKMNGIG